MEERRLKRREDGIIRNKQIEEDERAQRKSGDRQQKGRRAGEKHRRKERMNRDKMGKDDGERKREKEKGEQD